MFLTTTDTIWANQYISLESGDTLQASNMLYGGSTLKLRAPQRIVLTDGFHSIEGSNASIRIDSTGCSVVAEFNNPSKPGSNTRDGVPIESRIPGEDKFDQSRSRDQIKNLTPDTLKRGY